MYGDDKADAERWKTRVKARMENEFKLTKGHLETWFTQFNRDYFEAKLPQPKLALSHSKTQLGAMRFKKCIKMGKMETFDHSIRVSIMFKQDELGYKNVLLHEMIHYYIAYNNIQDTSPHGVVFRKMMNQLNSEYGWSMKVSESGKALQVAQERLPRSEFLVLALVLSNGKRFLSVVTPASFRKLNQQVKRVKELESYGWYVSSDVYFNAYPRVRTLRGVEVTPDFFENMLKTMTKLVISE